MVDNPYESPAATSVSGGGELSPALIDGFRRTKGWVMFFGIIMIIFAVLMLIATAGTFLSGSQASSAGMPFPIQYLSLVYLLGAILYFVLGMSLLKYSGAISRLAISGSMRDAEIAVDRQRSFWKLCGIMTIVGIVFYIVVFVAVIGFAASAI